MITYIYELSADFGSTGAEESSFEFLVVERSDGRATADERVRNAVLREVFTASSRLDGVKRLWLDSVTEMKDDLAEPAIVQFKEIETATCARIEVDAGPLSKTDAVLALTTFNEDLAGEDPGPRTSQRFFWNFQDWMKRGHQPEKAEAVKGDYSVVRVTDGPFAGRLGFYDDDADDDRLAIVYFGPPVLDDTYYYVLYAQLRLASEEEQAEFESLKNNELARVRAAKKRLKEFGED